MILKKPIAVDDLIIWKRLNNISFLGIHETDRRDQHIRLAGLLAIVLKVYETAFLGLELYPIMFINNYWQFYVFITDHKIVSEARGSLEWFHANTWSSPATPCHLTLAFTLP